MPGVIELSVRHPEDMQAMGEALGSILEAGDVVSLTGDLGAGKTNATDGVNSATYTPKQTDDGVVPW